MTSKIVSIILDNEYVMYFGTISYIVVYKKCMQNLILLHNVTNRPLLDKNYRVFQLTFNA